MKVNDMPKVGHILSGMRKDELRFAALDLAKDKRDLLKALKELLEHTGAALPEGASRFEEELADINPGETL